MYGLICQAKNMFSSYIIVALAAIWGVISAFLFPEAVYLDVYMAVLGAIVLDLLTKLYSLAKQANCHFFKGLRLAFHDKKINSKRFAKGTTDKLTIFLVLVNLCGLAYLISPITAISVGLMHTVFAVMFLRDFISILENLSDAGIGGLAIFKKIANKELRKICDTTEDQNSDDSNNPSI